MVENVWISYHASPKFMAPMHSGLTLTAAEGESKRCLPRRDFGGGAGFIVCRRLIVYDEMYRVYIIKVAEVCNGMGENSVVLRSLSNLDRRHLTPRAPSPVFSLSP